MTDIGEQHSTWCPHIWYARDFRASIQWFVTRLNLSQFFKATDLQAWVRLLVFADEIYRCLDRIISFVYSISSIVLLIFVL